MYPLITEREEGGGEIERERERTETERNIDARETLFGCLPNVP